MARANRFLKLIKCTSGFTLVEVLVTLAIFAFVAAAFNAVLLVGQSSWETNKVKVELNQELRKAMDWMKDDLRQTGPSAITDVPADGAWYTSITFQPVSGVSGGSRSWGASIQFVLGGTNSDQLQKIEGGATSVLAQDIASVQFRRLAASSDVLEVALQAQKDTVKGIPITADLDFRIQLRN